MFCPVQDQGEAVRHLYRLGRLFAAGVRIATMPVTLVIALLAASPDILVATVVIMGTVTLWSGAYVYGLLCRPARWYAVVDGCFLVAMCLGTRWVVPAEWLLHSNTWMLVFISFACVGYQCHTEILLGTAVTVCVVAALVFGTAAAIPAESTTRMMIAAGWSVVAATLSRVQWMLVRRGGRVADRQMTEAEEARTDQLVAEAVRTDEQRLANALHDTAATTLLMVGTGQAKHAGDLLGAQAARDLAVLHTYGARLPARSDLLPLLRTAADLVALDVEFTGIEELTLPTEVAGAIADAAGEALNNVVRHAMVDRAAIRVHGDQLGLRVDIEDAGKGFCLDEIADTRRGVRESIHGRMRSIGGSARIDTAMGLGTRIRLVWRDE